MWKPFSRLVAAAIVILAPSAAFAAEPLVSTEWLSAKLGAKDVIVVDLRTKVGGASKDDYLKAHIPGAQWSDYPGAWRTERDGVKGAVPSVEKLEAHLSELGVAEGRTVVLVPVGKGATDLGVATRIYWTLKYLGHDEVSILDGGWKAWLEAGLPTEAGEVTPTGDMFVAEPRPEYLIDTAQAAQSLNTGVTFLDARPEAQYRGKEKSGDVARFGRIPGAASLDQNLFYDGARERLKPLAELKAAVPAALAPDAPIVSYCNTGHWASINWFVLHELLGYQDVRLYADSMAGWTLDPERPVDSERTRLDDLKAWWNGLFS